VAVDVFDPHAGADDVKKHYDIDLINDIGFIKAHKRDYDAIILAVSHKEFIGVDWSTFSKPASVIFDTKAVLDRGIVDGRL
jgi:UDP-N-acetyl-D-galactosamine dehydrogenase